MSIEKTFRAAMARLGFEEVPSSDSTCEFKTPEGDLICLDIDRYYNAFAIFLNQNQWEKSAKLVC